MSRADRRRQLKDNRKRIARGVDVLERDAADVVALMRVLHDRARQAIAERSVAPLMEFLYGNIAATERRLAGVEVACRKGCSFCCHIWVVPCTMLIDKLCSDAMEREWLAGKDVLAPLPRAPGGDLFDAPWNRELFEQAFG